MSRTCTVCASAEVSKIDAELCEKRDSIRVIALRYRLGADAVQRHKACIQKKLARVAAAKDEAEVTTYKNRVERALNRVEKWIERLDETNDYRARTAYTRELRGLLDQYGGATGERTTPPAVSINIGAQPAAPQSPTQDFAHESPEDVAELLESELSAELGADKYERVIRLLVAGLPVTTTAESSQLAITENPPAFAPPLIR